MTKQPQRKRRQIFNCPPTDREHYAKNMCHNCYHRRGKSKKAWGCPHTNKSPYSGGLCQNCYLAKYYIKRKQKMQGKAAENEGDKTTEQIEAAEADGPAPEALPAATRSESSTLQGGDSSL